jgi:predicted nuclease with RNAse H fold
VLTLGIDLSTEAAKTAAVMLEWRDGAGTDYGKPTLGMSDTAVLHSMSAADKIGIDAPFGWPDAFRQRIDDWSENGNWPAGTKRSKLRYRLTDEFQLANGRAPLSVSADRIAATAMRCAELLARHCDARRTPLDRVTGQVIEVYPAAALMAWGFDIRGYKNADAIDQRRQMVAQLVQEARLQLTQQTLDLCAATDHALDALVACLVTRAQVLGLTHPAPAQRTEQVAREGWIHLPLPGSLQQLTGS